MEWIVQLTAGVGPWEVRRFVALLAEALVEELASRGACVLAESVMGDPEAPASIELLVSGSEDRLQELVGTHTLVARSPRRSKTDRKRWFVGVNLVQPVQSQPVVISPDSVEFQVSRAGGPGGQGVNTTDSAVRAVHRPSGLSVRVVTERSQHRNRQLALQRLAEALGRREAKQQAAQLSSRRQQHYRLERGQAQWGWQLDHWEKGRLVRTAPVLAPRPTLSLSPQSVLPLWNEGE